MRRNEANDSNRELKMKLDGDGRGRVAQGVRRDSLRAWDWLAVGVLAGWGVIGILMVVMG